MPTISAAARNAMLDAATALIDAGAGAGYIEIRTGSKPASPAVAASGTLLVTITFNEPAFGAAVAGVATLDAAPALTGQAVADGTAGWARVYDSDANAIMDGGCGTSGEFVNLDALAILTGRDVTVTGGTLTQPAE